LCDISLTLNLFSGIMASANTRKILVFGLIALFLGSTLVVQLQQCKPDLPANSKTQPTEIVKTPLPQAPPFNADSAFLYVKKQVDFGPRVPGSAAHKKCAAWLSGQFKRMGMTVIEQKFKAQAYFGALDAVNIIAQYKPELNDRILLCAHWDSRHIADKDNKDTNKPILGADDGGSGVAVLLELARMVQANPLNIGIDFILFDAEDLGDDRDARNTSIMQQNTPSETLQRTWCLGSQYWAANIHKANYRARFGILLDMVGAKGASFPLEGYSLNNAGAVQANIWSIASELGYGSLFVNRQAGGITDDHFFVMQGTKIPTVDIISIPREEGFGEYHHTHNDNMDIIDRNTLKAVGQTVATVLYRSGK
jgi:glutaminyl-peptide cyclotransferase